MPPTSKFVMVRLGKKNYPEKAYFSGDCRSNFNEVNNMSIENRIDATAKNIEGKIQETIGDITGNPEDKAEGQAKQTAAKVQHTVENAKDKVKKAID